MKLKDIRNNIDTSVDIQKQEMLSEFEVLWESSKSFNDLGESREDISLGWKDTIILEKKKSQSIDPLSKKTITSRSIPLTAKKVVIKRKKKKHILAWLKKYNLDNIYFAVFIFIFFAAGIFLYKDLLEKYLTYSYETLSFVRDDFPDYGKMQEDILEAKNGFLITKYLFKPISFLDTQSTRDAENLIVGWQKLTLWLEKMSRIGFDFQVLTSNKDISEILFSHFLDNSYENLDTAFSHMKDAYTHYQNVWELWDDDLNLKLEQMKKMLTLLLDNGGYVMQNFDSLLSIMWHNERKRYMIVFQNSDEIRPQWWFMGSVWFVDIFWGNVVNFEKKDIYALEYEINKDPFRDPAPKGIDRLTGTFGLRDANYFVWVWASSERIRELLQRANMEIDGIIYTNLNLANDILDSIGWFESEALDTQVTSDNFALLMSSLVESKNLKIGTLGSPKDVLFDFIDELTIDLQSRKDYSRMSQLLLKNIESRDIFMYVFDDKEAEFLNKIWLDWSIDYGKNLDYNYPVFTSLSWNKSDRYVERSFSKYVTLFDNCVISTRLNVKLRHNFSLADEKMALEIFDNYDIDMEENLEIQWLWTNKQFVRIVLPKDSIIKNKNVEVKNYPNTRVVEFFMETPRFESTYFVLSYLIPNTECNNYDYSFYKQPWISSYNIDFTLWDENTKITWIREDFEYKLQ